MSERKAFTLVELLVVIAIIALLIAILAPSLKAAKDLAKATYCKTTLNALNKSALVYTELNKGYMMVYRHSTTDYNGVPVPTCPSQPDRTSVAFGGNRSPATGLLDNPMQYGLVYALGLMGPAEMFYCPAPIQDERHMLSNYPKPWGSRTGPGSNLIRVGYMWNPWITIITGGGQTTDGTFDDRLVLSRHPNERFLTTDMILSSQLIGHTTGIKAYWNHGYTDGHVEQREYPEVYDLLSVGGDMYRLEWKAWKENVQVRLEKG